MRIIALFALATSLWAVAPVVSINGPTLPTQALIRWTTAYGGTCTVIVSESPTLTPVINDLNLTYFPSANTDNILDHRLIGSTYHTQFLIGHRDAPTTNTGVIKGRGMAAATPHYGSLTCDGETTLFGFTTAIASGLTPENLLFNANGHGNTAIEQWDWDDKTKPIIDPQTGVKHYRVGAAAEYGDQLAQTFAPNSVFLGTGWTNLQNLASGVVGTLATTNNTNYACIPIQQGDYLAAIGGFQVSKATLDAQQMANIAAHVYGSGTDANGTNRQAEVALSIDSCQTAYTSPLTVTLPQTTADDVGLFPSAVAQGFQGWSRAIPGEARMMQGYVTVAGNDVTLQRGPFNDQLTSGGMAGGWFRPEWPVGTRIYIAGSSPTCALDLCTLASYVSRTHITISESLTLPTNTLYRSANFAFMVRKTNATGSISFSMGYSMQTFFVETQGQGIACSPRSVEVTQANDGSPLGYTAIGHLCLFPLMRDSFTKLKIAFTTPERDAARSLAMIKGPGTCSGCMPDDYPTDTSFGIGPASSGFAFDPVEPNTFYTLQATQASGNPKALFKIVYDAAGGYREPSGILNSYNAVTGTFAGYTEPLTWHNMTPPSQNLTVPEQILASTSYDLAYWPALSGLGFAGITNGYAQFQIALQGGQNYPIAVFYFDAATGLFSSWWDGLTNAPPGSRFVGNHNTTPFGGYGVLSAHTLSGPQYSGTLDTAGTAATLVSGDAFNSTMTAGRIKIGSAYHTATYVDASHLTLSPSAGVQSGAAWGINVQPSNGAFLSTWACVFKVGVCDPDTSLPGVIGDPSYDGACPADLPAWAITQGAVGDQCVTVEVEGEPCSIYATPLELSTFPCPNAASTDKAWMGVAVAPMDSMYDNKDPNTQMVAANEQMGLVKKTLLSGERWRMVFLRDNATGYNCQADNPRGRTCVAVPAQAVHTNGWAARWIPASLVPVYDMASQTFTQDNFWLMRAHTDRSVDVEGVHTLVGVTGFGESYYARVGGDIGGNATAELANYPPFAGIRSNSGGANQYQQTYLGAAATAARGIYKVIGSDWRILNDGAAEPETPGQFIGITHTFTLQGGTTSVYRVCGPTSCATPGSESGISGTYDPKKTQLVGTAGLYGMAEKSSATPGNTLTDADTWKFCYAFIAGECRVGSVAGSTYMVIPNLETDVTRCTQGLMSYRNVCLSAATSVFDRVPQLLYANDPDGIYQRTIGNMLNRYSGTYAYSHTRPFPDGKCVLGTSYNLYGWWSGITMACPGAWLNDSQNRTAFVGVTVEAGKPGDSWYVRAGYNSALECTPRSGACMADSTTSTTTPMKLSGETPSAVSGHGTITIAAIPGRVLCRALVINGTQGATKCLTVP